MTISIIQCVRHQCHDQRIAIGVESCKSFKIFDIENKHKMTSYKQYKDWFRECIYWVNQIFYTSLWTTTNGKKSAGALILMSQINLIKSANSQPLVFE